MKRVLLFCFFFGVVSAVSAADPIVLKLWPGGAPAQEGGALGPEKELPRKTEKDAKCITNVTEPTITVYPAEHPNGTAVLVCPGGGYSVLSIENEGTQACEWLNKQGVAAVLLKYRVPQGKQKDPSAAPLQDAQRAMGLVRHHAVEWGIRPDRVGILGFSAGGHLAIMTSLHPNERTYEPDAALDVTDATPSFCVPVYPAYLVEKENTFALKPEIKVTEKAPPICIIHGGEDKGVTSSSASALLYLEYKKLSIPAELHIFAKGGHAFGMKKAGNPVNDWPERVQGWMKSMGWME